MKFKLNSSKFFKKIFLPIVFLGFLMDFNFFRNEIHANSEIKPANDKDLALYEGMGVSYLCLASRKEVDLDFEKSLGVAASTFVAVVQSKHGGLIVGLNEGKDKEIKVDPKVLFENVSYRILGRAIQNCSESVPKKSKKEFDRYLKELEKFMKNK